MSMLPKSKSRRWLTAGLAIGLVTAAASTWLLAIRGSADDGRFTVVATGTLEADEISVSTKISARVAEVAAADGQEVKAGAVLLSLDLSELAAERLETVASLHDAEARLALVKAGRRSQEIERTRAEMAEAAHNLDRLMNGSRPEETLQAAGALRAAQAAYDQAAREQVRASTLYASGDVSRSRREQADADLEAAKGRLEVSQQQLALANAGARSEDRDAAREQWRQRQAAYDLARAGARPEEIAAAQATVERITATLKRLDIQLAEARIAAPVDGTVTHVVARTGEVVAPGQPLATMVSRSSQWVDVFVEEAAIGAMEIGQPAELTLRAFPGRTFPGRVSSINETAVGERQTKESMNVRSLRVRIQVERGDRFMRPGMSVEVRISTGPTT